MSWKSLPKHSDYGLGPAYTTEFSLVGKNNVAEKVRVMENPGLFSKDFKVRDMFGETQAQTPGVKMR